LHDNLAAVSFNLLLSGVKGLAWVPEFRPVKSKVTPDGTAIAERIIVEQEVFDLLAREAPVDPLKVQVVARFAIALLRSGAAVGIGIGTGPAKTPARVESPKRAKEKLTMIGS
jgi:hypothetical protein